MICRTYNHEDMKGRSQHEDDKSAGVASQLVSQNDELSKIQSIILVSRVTDLIAEVVRWHEVLVPRLTK